jgi:hypothetical protein
MPGKYVLYRRGSRVSSENRATAASNEEVGQNAGARPTLRAVTLKCFARQKESRARHLHKFETDIRKNFVYLLNARIPDREFGVNDCIDKNRATDGGSVQLMQRPRRPFRIVRRNVEENVGIDKRHQLSLRVSAMISSVERPPVAVPRIRSKRLGLTARPPTARKKARPSSAISKSTLLPGVIPRRSRTGLGIVTWPLRVTVTATSASRNT